MCAVIVLAAVAVGETEAHAVAVHLYNSMLLIALSSHQYRLNCLESYNL